MTFDIKYFNDFFLNVNHYALEESKTIEISGKETIPLHSCQDYINGVSDLVRKFHQQIFSIYTNDDPDNKKKEKIADLIEEYSKNYAILNHSIKKYLELKKVPKINALVQFGDDFYTSTGKKLNFKVLDEIKYLKPVVSLSKSLLKWNLIICEFCGELKVVKSPLRKYCSEDCQKKAKAERLRERNLKRENGTETRYCVVCGNILKSKRIDAKTCSPKCRKQLSRKNSLY